MHSAKRVSFFPSSVIDNRHIRPHSKPSSHFVIKSDRTCFVRTRSSNLALNLAAPPPAAPLQPRKKIYRFSPSIPLSSGTGGKHRFSFSLLRGDETERGSVNALQQGSPIRQLLQPQPHILFELNKIYRRLGLWLVLRGSNVTKSLSTHNHLPLPLFQW